MTHRPGSLVFLNVIRDPQYTVNLAALVVDTLESKVVVAVTDTVWTADLGREATELVEVKAEDNLSFCEVGLLAVDPRHVVTRRPPSWKEWRHFPTTRSATPQLAALQQLTGTAIAVTSAPSSGAEPEPSPATAAASASAAPTGTQVSLAATAREDDTEGDDESFVEPEEPGIAAAAARAARAMNTGSWDVVPNMGAPPPWMVPPGNLTSAMPPPPAAPPQHSQRPPPHTAPQLTQMQAPAMGQQQNNMFGHCMPQFGGMPSPMGMPAPMGYPGAPGGMPGLGAVHPWMQQQRAPPAPPQMPFAQSQQFAQMGAFASQPPPFPPWMMQQTDPAQLQQMMQWWTQMQVMREFMRAADSSDPTALSGGSTFARSLNQMQNFRERRKTHGMQIYAEYEKLVLEKMHVLPGQYWSWIDWWRTLPFQQFRSVGRMAYGFAEVIEQLRDNNTATAMATAVGCLKAAHQFSLDGGHWRTAWELTALPEPYMRSQFGGTPLEINTVSSYLKAVDDIESRRSSSAPPRPGRQPQSQATAAPAEGADEKPEEADPKKRGRHPFRKKQ